MSENNTCPDCKKFHYIKPKQCMCGHFFTNESSRICRGMTDDVPCNVEGTITVGINGAIWYCSKHIGKAREESYPIFTGEKRI